MAVLVLIASIITGAIESIVAFLCMVYLIWFVQDSVTTIRRRIRRD